MKISKKITFILVVISVGVSIVRIVASAAFSTSGIELTKLQSENQKVENENISLKEAVYKTSALTYISAKAREEGFIESGKSITLSIPLPVAYK